MNMEQQKFSLEKATFEDNFLKMSDEEISNPNAFEWYYFDLKNDNTSMVIQFKRKDACIHEDPFIQFEYKSPTLEYEKLQIYKPQDFSVHRDSDKIYRIKIGPNTLTYTRLENQKMKISIELSIEHANIKAEITPSFQGFKPNKDGRYFHWNKLQEVNSNVVFAAPCYDGVATGEIADEKIELKGKGYHDHPWGTSNLMRTHAKWHWAHINTESFTFLYTDVTPKKNVLGQLKYLFIGKKGQYEPILSEDFSYQAENWGKQTKFSFPHKFTIENRHPKFTLVLDYLETVLDLSIYNRSKVKAVYTDSEGKKEEGEGWLEYFEMPGLPPSILEFANKSKFKKWIKGIPKKK